jgi:hypothetical protein
VRFPFRNVSALSPAVSVSVSELFFQNVLRRLQGSDKCFIAKRPDGEHREKPVNRSVFGGSRREGEGGFAPPYHFTAFGRGILAILVVSHLFPPIL